MRFVLLFTCIAILSSGCSSEKPVARDEEDLAARVNDWTFTRAQLQEIIDRLSDSEKAKYDTPGGRAKLADGMIQEELYYREGLKLDIPTSEEVVKKLEAYERALVIETYYLQHVRSLAAPSEEEMHDYYEANLARYTQQPIGRAQHILSKNDPDKLREYKRLVETKKELFTRLAQKYSDDEMTREDGGDLGYFNPGGYMRGVGYSDEISEAAFSLEVGDISNPIKWRKGWSIVVLNELRPGLVKPFEDVVDDITEVLIAPRLDRIKELAYAELGKKYQVSNYLANEFKLTSKTPEELWNLAQNSLDSFERLRHYEEIVERFPDSPHAAKAMFMIGFVNAEELKNLAAADQAFTQVINKFPDSDVAESAKYMLETMYKSDPGLSKPGEESESEKSGEHEHGGK